MAALSPFLALTASWVPRVLLGVIVLDIPLQFGTHFFFREEDAAEGALGGLSFSVTTLALIGLYLLWFLKFFSRQAPDQRRPIHISVPLAVYLGISAISLAFAEDVALSFFELFLLGQLFLVYTYVANFVRTRRDVMFVVSLLLLGSVLAGLGIINLRVAGMPPVIAGLPWGLPTRVQVDEYADGSMRVGGTIGSPNNAGAYFAFVLTLAACLLFTDVEKRKKWLAMAALGIGGLALIFTFSRGAWAAYVLSMGAVLLLFAGRLRHFSWKAPVVGILVFIVLCLPFQQMIAERLFGDDRGAAESRIPLMKLASRIISDNPVLGVGSNNFPVVMGRYITSEFRSGFLYTVHNKFLLVWAETGLLGLSAYLIFLLGSLRKGWRCWRVGEGLLATLALGCAAALAGHMVQMTVEVFNGRPLAQLVWLTGGLLTAMHRMCAQPSPEPRPAVDWSL